MNTTTPVPNSKLSGWYFSLAHCRYIIEQRLKHFESQGWDTSYDRAHLERITDMEQFVKMSWDAYMDSLMDRANGALHDLKVTHTLLQECEAREAHLDG